MKAIGRGFMKNPGTPDQSVFNNPTGTPLTAHGGAKLAGRILAVAAEPREVIALFAVYSMRFVDQLRFLTPQHPPASGGLGPRGSLCAFL